MASYKDKQMDRIFDRIKSIIVSSTPAFMLLFQILGFVVFCDFAAGLVMSTFDIKEEGYSCYEDVDRYGNEVTKCGSTKTEIGSKIAGILFVLWSWANYGDEIKKKK